MNLKQYVGALVAAVLLGSSLVGCAVEDEKPEPYEPQVTHTPKAKKTDDAGAGEDGLDDGGTSEDSTAEPGSDLEALEPPPVPDRIYKNSLKGAEAAARYFIEANAYAFKSHDSDPLKFVCSEESDVCSQQIDEVKNLSAAGEAFTAGELVIGETRDLHYSQDGAFVSVPYFHPGFTIHDIDGQLIQAEGSFQSLCQVVM